MLYWREPFGSSATRLTTNCLWVCSPVQALPLIRTDHWPLVQNWPYRRDYSMSETEEKVPFISVGEDGLPHSRVYGVDGENVPASQTHLPRELVQFGSDPLTTDSVGAECRPDTDNVEAAARSELTKRDWLLVIVLGLGNLVVQAYYSLLGPFYAIKVRFEVTP